MEFNKYLQNSLRKNMNNLNCGIYLISNLVNGKVYIGSAVSLNSRLNTHFLRLQKQKHENCLLQRAWNKYGKDAFGFIVVEYCPKEQLLEREQFYLDSLKSYDTEFGYNICKIAGTPQQKHTEETKDKISKARKGRMCPIEVRLKISETKRKLCDNPQFRQKMSRINKERYKNPIERKKLSQRSIEKWQQPEYRERLIKIQKERCSNLFEKRRLSEQMKGKKHSIITRRKMSDTHKKRYLDLRELQKII